MKAQIARRFSMVVAPAAAAFLLGLLPCFAQAPGPGYPSMGQYPQPPSIGQTPQAQASPSMSLPDGVSKIYANEGNNQLLVMATQEGYEAVRELVRNLTGQLDIIQTKVVSVEASRSDLNAADVFLQQNTSKQQSISLDPQLPPGIPDPIYAQESTNSLYNPAILDLSDPIVTGRTATNLLTALQNGALQPTETLRITTREGMPIDTLLRQRGRRLAAGGTPFTLIPREEQDGSLTMQIMQPASTEVTVKSGQTAVVALPGSTSDSVQLLFLTPVLLPSNARSAR